MTEDHTQDWDRVIEEFGPPVPSPQRSEILAAECRALIKRIDDLLHDNDAEAAHIELHELAHKFEQWVANEHSDHG